MQSINGSAIIKLFACFILGIICSVLMLKGISDESIALLIRLTARTSITLFLIAFGATALHHFFSSNLTQWFVKNRRYIGISFVVSHYIHLACILFLQFQLDNPLFEERGLTIVSLGALAYVLMSLMALTSTDRAIQKMGIKNWKTLHWIGSHYIWIVFSSSYIPRAFSDSFYIPFALSLVLIMLLRMMTYLQKRRM